jgi:hypothetical protein
MVEYEVDVIFRAEDAREDYCTTRRKKVLPCLAHVTISKNDKHKFKDWDHIKRYCLARSNELITTDDLCLITNTNPLKVKYLHQVVWQINNLLVPEGYRLKSERCLGYWVRRVDDI